MTRSELIERLEAATGPDFALDLEIATALVPQIVVMRRNNADTSNEPHTYRAFTADVGDAIWLVEALLPGWGWDVASNTEHIKACLNPEYGEPIGKHPHWAAVANTSRKKFHDGATPAIALCLSLLKALERKDGE